MNKSTAIQKIAAWMEWLKAHEELPSSEISRSDIHRQLFCDAGAALKWLEDNPEA